MQENTASMPSDRYRTRITSAMEILESAPSERMTVAELANEVAMSPFHFHRIFRALTGETVGDVTRRFRLARGLRFLRDSDMSITDIALEVGYESSQNFTKAFKAVTGVTPSEVRSNSGLEDKLINRLAKPRFIITKEFTMSDIKITTVPLFTTVGIQHKGPYEGLGSVYEKLRNWIATNNLFSLIEGFYSVYYNDPNEVAAEDIRTDACIKLSEPVETNAEMTTIELGGGEHAVFIHKGPYEELRNAYDMLYGRWLPSSNRELADKPPFEKYLNDPATTKPEDLLTEIYLPLK